MVMLMTHEICIMTKRIRPQVKDVEMRFLQGIIGVTSIDRIRNRTIGEKILIEKLFLLIERSQLLWFGLVACITLNRIPSKIQLGIRSKTYTMAE